MPVSTQEAHDLIAAAQRHAEAIGIKATVAIVDEGGHLLALSRMDGAFSLSAQIAEAKAIGPAVWYRDGASLKALHAERPAFFEAVGKLTRVPLIPGLGSAVLRRDGRALGGVGISGGSSEQDQECVDVALRAVGLESE